MDYFNIRVGAFHFMCLPNINNRQKKIVFIIKIQTSPSIFVSQIKQIMFVAGIVIEVLLNM